MVCAQVFYGDAREGVYGPELECQLQAVTESNEKEELPLFASLVLLPVVGHR